MKTLVFCLWFAFSTTGLFSQGYPGETFGGSDNDVGLSICTTPEGGYAIAGSTRSMGAGSNDFYFIKLDSGGQLLIEKTYGWLHQDFFRKVIATDSGFVFVGDAWDYGPGGLDIYLMHTDKCGCIIWGKFFGTMKRDNGFDVLPTDDGGYLVLGHSRRTNPKGDVYLLKIDASQQQQWVRSYWDEYNDYAFQIIRSTGNDGYVFIGSKNGFFDDVHADFQSHDADIMLIKIDDQGTQIWKKLYGKNQHDFGYSLCAAADGGYYLLGSSQSYGHGSFDMLLIKTNEDGEEQWHKSFGGSDFEYGKSIAKNQAGNLYLLGSSKSFGTDGSVDVYVVKTDSDGNEIWSETIGGSGNDFGESLVITVDGGCAIAGSTESFGNGKKDAYFLKLLPDGKVDIFEGLNPSDSIAKLLCYPNPMNCTATFKIEKSFSKNFVFDLYNINGQLLQRNKVEGHKFVFHRNWLSAGTYFYHFVSKDDGTVFKGKLIVR